MSNSTKVDVVSTASPMVTTTYTIASGGAICHGVYVNTAPSHAINVVDYNTTVSPNTSVTLAVIPASGAAGSSYEFPGGLKATHSLRITTTNAAATGDVTVMWSKGVPGLVTA